MKNRRIAIIVGKTGYGKSYIVKKYVAQVERCVIFDINSEYEINGFKIISDFNQFKQELIKYCDDSILRYVLRFDDYDCYELAFKLCYIAENITIVVEEISNFSNAYGTSKTLEKLIRFGRHKSISLVGISQRFADISVLLRNQLDLLICFNLTAPNDIAYLEQLDYVGEKAQDVPKLKQGQSLYFINR